MTSAHREIIDWLAFERSLERDHAAAMKGSPAEVVYARLYPGQTFSMKKDRNHLLEVTRIEGDTAYFTRKFQGRQATFSEFPLSVTGFCAAIENPPTL